MTVNPDRWQQIKQVFDDALRREPPLRAAFVAAACADDASLLAEVEQLLDSYQSDSRAQPAVGVSAEMIAEDALSQLRAGQTLSHYRIIQPLGKGGMGEVYLAQDTKLKRSVALKVLLTVSAGDEQAQKRLLREAQAVARLEHQNICTIYEAGESQGRNYIAMQYIDGETLADKLRRNRLSQHEILSVAIQVTEALAEAHAQDLIHRDVKPSNIMITARGVVKVLDFGLAKFVADKQNDHLTETRLLSAPGAVIGTIPYMSPEQARGARLDARTDIFSFGVVLYEMLSGQQPFSRHSQAETSAAILTYEPPFDKLAGFAPQELKRITRKCLAKQTEARYQTASELLRDLRALEKHLMTASESDTVALESIAQAGAQRVEADTKEQAAHTRMLQETRDVSPSRRRRALLLGALTVGLIAIAAVSLWLLFTRRPSLPTIGIERVRQVTDWSGLDDFPSMSPDGNSVVYASDHNGSFEIYVKALIPGAKEGQLTNDGQQNFQPAWSPNGQYIAYHSKQRGGIWVMPASGGEARQLTDFGTHPAWSPDGKQIAFQSYPVTDLGAGARIAMPPSTLWLVPAQGGGQPKQLTQVGTPAGGHGAPAWSPNGKRIAFEVDDYNYSSVWSISSSGANARLVSQWGFEPVYTPDGKSIVFINGGVQQISIDPDSGELTGEPKPISGQAMPQSLRRVNFSADGRRMVYNTLTRTESLASVSVKPGSSEAVGTPVTIVQKVSGRIHQESFSPDGKRLAFTSCLRGGSSCDIWLANTDGTNQTQLTTDESNENMASWFPDMTEIAFTSSRTPHRTLWAIDLNTKRERMLLDLQDEIAYYKLSPDGKQIVLNLNRNGGAANVWTATLAGGEPKQLTFDKEEMGFPSWSPDGKLIAFQMKRGDDSHIMFIPAAGGTPTQLTFAKGQSWAYSWAPDNDKILFAGSRNSLWNVYWVSRSTKKEQQLTDYKRLNSFVRYPAWSPLGNQIVYEYSETTGNIWVADLK